MLKVISRSTFDLQTVLDTLVESAAQLCEAEMAAIVRPKDEAFYQAASFGFSPQFLELVREYPIRVGRGTVAGRSLLEGKPVHIHDAAADPEHTFSEAQRLAGFHTMLGVPLLREGTAIGVIILTRSQVRPFTEKQIELVTTFADQAVIAIENVRLLALRQRTDELGRSVDELRALGEVSQAVNSTLDLETVLTTIVGRAVQLSRTDAGAIYVFDEERKEFRLHATYGMSETMIAAITDRHIGLGDANIGAATTQRKPIQVPDIRNQPSPINEIILREGYRGILIIPLLRPDHIVGALVVRRKTPGEFANSTIDLLQTFADQSVVAIQNARLFESVEARTRELAKSLGDLRTAQDRLVQTEKLASLGQLTAGIAHEIKNPLNFVNNFSAVSVELIDELREALEGRTSTASCAQKSARSPIRCKAISTRSCNTASARTRSSRTCCYIRVRARESTGRSILTPWSMRASISPITGLGLRSRCSCVSRRIVRMSFTVVRFARFRLGIVPLTSWRGNTASTALPKTDRHPCPGISEIAVPELLKYLSAIYRNPVRELPKHAIVQSSLVEHRHVGKVGIDQPGPY